MVLTLNDLFRRIKETQEDMIYRVTMSYLEVIHQLACEHSACSLQRLHYSERELLFFQPFQYISLLPRSTMR